MKHIALLLSCSVVLSGCASLPRLQTPDWLRGSAAPRSVAQPQQPTEPLPAPVEVDVAPITDEPRPEPTSSGFLGKTIASLGDATKDGFWIETPLVAAKATGRVRYPANGREVKVDLIPLTGLSTGGSYMSLGAMRLLDAPLAGLPEVEVYQD
ncbi:MAG: hypothetical protein JXR13_18275 [Thalassovita sp.]